MDDPTKDQNSPDENESKPFFLNNENLTEARSQGLGPNIQRFFGFLGIVADTIVELQALSVRSIKAQIYRGGNGFAHAQNIEKAVQLLSEADQGNESFNAQGLYLVPNKVDPDVVGRGVLDSWNEAQKGASTTDRDITHRRMVVVDCDAVRPSGVSATETQTNASMKRALRVAKYLRGPLIFVGTFRARCA